MREVLIEKYLVSEVKKLLGENRKIQWIARRGAPDRLVWIPGWKYPKMPELKAPGKPLKEHQKREHKRLRKMGIYCCKLDSYEDVDKFLKTK
jgi:hypothetical protein